MQNARLDEAQTEIKIAGRSINNHRYADNTTLMHRLGWACVLCSSQVRAAQVMRCLASTNAATYHLPATRLSGCKTGAPSQADVDCPDPQEVLVSKEAL